MTEKKSFFQKVYEKVPENEKKLFADNTAYFNESFEKLGENKLGTVTNLLIVFLIIIVIVLSIVGITTYLSVAIVVFIVALIAEIVKYRKTNIFRTGHVFKSTFAWPYVLLKAVLLS